MKNTIDDNMYKDIQPEDHIINVNMREKSFSISIHDRDLHNVNNLSYNINMDGQKYKIFSNNTKDDPTYVSNNVYSGINITNNSLNGNHHVDNPIKKQKTCLFHKWLDRHRHKHRHMCKNWNNKEKMLNKLNEKCNMQHKEHILGIPTSTHDDTDMNKINDETYNMIGANNMHDHDNNEKSPLDNLRSKNIPPNDITTKNNDFQTKNLRTYISTVIRMDEKNNVTCEDNLENFYNF
ncbi:erythrocyte membrane protein 1 (PfEMP1), exon 2, putative [Plasmodium reichenowi]|uniref:Erythrocyte membrane protein 1 (PfEMP1), exon 2, putative n=1 Tax=Plasmodium reichenowi TaxID=5854 RepID=A0A2P9DT22_PLARE|nr:erythrocyte membrane protein 1 (PfEMP1), exon 2, putative [Plasmodium reichenowi]